jgi:hypothetical protein
MRCVTWRVISAALYLEQRAEQLTRSAVVVVLLHLLLVLAVGSKRTSTRKDIGAFLTSAPIASGLR